MKSRFVDLPRVQIAIQADQVLGPFEWWRHSIGHGGINSRVLPGRVIQGTRKLRPRLVRTFLQEYLRIYPETGVFDWSRCISTTKTNHCLLEKRLSAQIRWEYSTAETVTGTTAVLNRARIIFEFTPLERRNTCSKQPKDHRNSKHPLVLVVLMGAAVIPTWNHWERPAPAWLPPSP